jgi:hypothetical protein
MSSADFKSAVEAHLAQAGSPLDFRPDEDQLRGVATAVLVATVKGVSSVLVGIINAVSAAAKGKAGRKIILQGAKGARVEMPADTPPDQIEALIRQARLLDVETIRIGLV